MKRALVLVDIQNDFIPGGSLAVPQGDEVVAIANRLMNETGREKPRYDLVVATQDWHPANHGSFASNHPGKNPFEMGELGGLPQVMWPDHCVQGTVGAEFHPDLDQSGILAVFQKGTNPEVDSYSGLLDNDKKSSTGLAEFLKEQGVTDVDVCGLATDYCVKATAIDAIAAGFKTRLLAFASRGVNMNPTDSEAACAEVQAAGGEVIANEENV